MYVLVHVSNQAVHWSAQVAERSVTDPMIARLKVIEIEVQDV